jgi:hypothetical protein
MTHLRGGVPMLWLKRGIPWSGFPPIQGVYCILDTGGDEEPCNAGWMYVGSSEDCYHRYLKHDSDLRRGCHHCGLLQGCCTGIDDNRWRFVVLEEVDYKLLLLERERFWLQRTVQCFNREDRILRSQLPSR